jgi:hypothetical protein
MFLAGRAAAGRKQNWDGQRKIFLEPDPVVQKSAVVETKVIRFPVYCPTCQKEWTYGLPQDQILKSLNTGTAIPVYAACHNKTWNLSDSEREDLAARSTQL